MKWTGFFGPLWLARESLSSLRSTRLPAAQAIGMMIRHTTMPKTKVALTLDSELLEQVDELVDRRRFRSRSADPGKQGGGFDQTILGQD
jgi:ribbon-helix-helix CopG family protein